MTIVPSHPPPALVIPPLPLPDLREGGRLAAFVAEWAEIGADSWVLNVIGKGLTFQFISRPPLSPLPRPVSLPKDSRKREALLEEVDAMLRKDALVELQELDEAGFYSHLFVVAKRSGGLRPVIDLKLLNLFIVCPHFKMETALSIRAQLQVGEWTISLDLSDAYLHMLVHPKFQRYLRFHIRGKSYQFRAMCFGLCTAPFLFTRVMKAVAAHLRAKSIRVHLYLDDWLVRADSREALLRDAQYVLNVVTRLGLIINVKKSHLVPSQRFQFLGMAFDLETGLVRPSLENRHKISVWIQCLRDYRVVLARDYLSFLGLLSHAADFIPLGRLRLRPLQFYLKCFWSLQLDLATPIHLDGNFFSHLEWWAVSANLSRGAPLSPPPSQLTLFTDASLSGWGAYLQGQSESGLWTGDEASLHINELEMLAIHRAVLRFKHVLSMKPVLVMSDNTTVVSYIKRQGGTKSLSLCVRTIRLFELCQSLGMTLLVAYIPGSRNVAADAQSRRGQVLPAEWTLSRRVFQQIAYCFPGLQVDLFATRWNAQLDMFVSPFPDQSAWAVDALSLPWHGLVAYAYPPTNLIALVLKKVQSSSVRLVLVAPCWPTQPWFPLLLSLLVEIPLALPLDRKLLRQPDLGVFHSSPAHLRLHAWHVSGVDSLRRDFLNRLRNEHPNLNGNLPFNCTNPGGPVSNIGVTEGVLIRSLPLFSK